VVNCPLIASDPSGGASKLGAGIASGDCVGGGAAVAVIGGAGASVAVGAAVEVGRGVEVTTGVGAVEAGVNVGEALTVVGGGAPVVVISVAATADAVGVDVGVLSVDPPAPSKPPAIIIAPAKLAPAAA